MIAALSPEFVLPKRLEAREPAERRGVPRDAVRLLLSDRASGAIAHARFDALPALLQPGDVIVVNDSATLPAALEAHRADGTALRLHVSSAVGATLWIVEPRGAATAGDVLDLPAGGRATLLTPIDPRSERLWFARADVCEPYVEYLYANGLPIHYSYVDRPFPIGDYQTVFARIPGSAEMPSAGRPFTAATLDALRQRGIELRSLTLHCGVASAEAHEPPQAEWFDVPAATAAAVEIARSEGRRVIAIGTTVVRALESAVRDGHVVAASGWTERIVTPAQPPAAVDGLLTGLHESRASHLQMLAAFLAPGALAAAYDAALSEGYLWHEFGDVHLIV